MNPIKTPTIPQPCTQEPHYRILPTTLRQDGFGLVQVYRNGMVAIYQKTKGKYVGYEVVLIRQRDEYEIAGKIVPAAECYPSNESWGTYGWTCATMKEAQERVFDRPKVGP